MQVLNIIRTDSTNSDFIELVRLLDKDLAIRDGDDHAFYAQFNKTSLLSYALVAYVKNEPVACGALKAFGPATMEVKRMFVAEPYRRMGIAHAVLRELEKWAGELGVVNLVLETGKNQPEAINLYRKAGYQVTENYGQYIGIENSVCFLRTL